ncbi:peptidase domain-containing ABC transporter [Herbaspirillum sp. alder98]|uniref:peptidase domain-containing ABC transporter n=1 Tax=Herbaspirillum sp. alder98 TaxID=2913096 RepID=UPI001CD848CF|nr:peptidase domain-containing ABC transporter [Herbaspirillum sp. alder98]MCA1326536.1 peptidase domain-containing ABC transporter [Herbaspirillum sp. alder98]
MSKHSFSQFFRRGSPAADSRELTREHFFWIVQSLCALHRTPFSSALLAEQFCAPYCAGLLAKALEQAGFDVQPGRRSLKRLRTLVAPVLLWLHPLPDSGDQRYRPCLLLGRDDRSALIALPGQAGPEEIGIDELAQRHTGDVLLVSRPVREPTDGDPDGRALRRPFGFAWFGPELLKYRRLWQEVLLASLVIQLMALGTPLLTQTIIDKVIVHHTRSTLVVLVIGMACFALFSALLSWLRQYLILHTGNRIDASLGAAVFEHLLRLPPVYFQHRQTGVVTARLQGVETIREFLAGAAITLILDLPFLMIFVGIMFYYSTSLALIVLAVLAMVMGLSLAVAPLFQARLQRQFMMGARNQAFVTEYVAAIETVKSLQLEPQLRSRYRGFLAAYLQAGFSTRQLGNSYDTVAGLLEQAMTLLILGIGAYTVMESPEFTIGMLIAFQMFAARLSQPMMRLVGLWQQFQQARLAVARLGDLMDAVPEPYVLQPTRQAQRRGEVSIVGLGFRYDSQQPWLYQGLSLNIDSGQTVAVMGASGCGKSTLAKLLQGFYVPRQGRILINDIDIRHLGANELRRHFGVVPQETTLFAGTILDNLLLANPLASFEQICQATRMAEIHADIEALGQGYQSEIGERGVGLSGGQRQRIAIARALLKRPEILIFDEATSALDGVTAAAFAQTVNQLRGKVTMLFITHGLPPGLVVDALYRITPHGVEAMTPPVAAEDATP